jgi:hypothetical protein
MPRTRTSTTALEDVRATLPQPVVILPTAVFTVPQVRTMLGLKKSSLRREIREGRRAVNKRCGQKCLVDEAMRAGKKINVEYRIAQLDEALKARVQEPWVWEATRVVAEKLRDEGAISGQTVKDLFEDSKELYAASDA